MTQSAFLRDVDEKLAAVLAAEAAAVGVTPQDLGWRAGKRARPRLVHACAEALRLVPEAAVSWAALVEMIHVASLVHDDVIDAAESRRGRASLPARDGNRRAVLGGDLVVSAAWLAASRELPGEVTAILARAMLEMTAAEMHERELLWNPDVRFASYLRVIDGKTAALFAAAAEGTAALAGAPLEARRAVTRCARALGRAFQIQDDVRDYQQTPAASGKDAMKDLREGVVTLPLIVALREPGPRAAAVRRYLTSRGEAGLEPQLVEKLLAESDALERSLRVARRTLRLGIRHLRDVVSDTALGEVATSVLGWAALVPPASVMPARGLSAAS